VFLAISNWSRVTDVVIILVSSVARPPKGKAPSCQFSGEPRRGGLISYGPDRTDLWGRSANPVDKILRGTKPAAIPVEQPTKFDPVINLKTANLLGLSIPPTLLARADDVTA
jgi:putative tryptophan/tyrosine transport system substrate-binding protein